MNRRDILKAGLALTIALAGCNPPPEPEPATQPPASLKFTDYGARYERTRLDPFDDLIILEIDGKRSYFIESRYSHGVAIVQVDGGRNP